MLELHEQYDIDGSFLLQEIKFRLGESDFFAGGRYQYLGSSVDFDGLSPDKTVPGVSQGKFDSSVGQLGLLLGYDSRDSIFSPNNGIKADLEAMFAEKAFGSDFVFQKYRFSALVYTQLGKKIGLGWRMDGRVARGDTPFYALPFIELRGIPAMRYQDNVAVMSELQVNYKLNPRWSVLGFGGIGKATDSISDLGSGDAKKTIGSGFRYLIARRLGLRAGIDVARGPEEWALYIQVGNAWLR